MIRLVLRNLCFYWRTNLGVLLGATCATAVLVGALAVGDSVRLSLRDQALLRIGRVDAALVAGDRHFGTALADRIEADLGTPVAPVLSLPGIAKSQQGADRRAGIVDVYGVDDRFFAMSLARPAPGADQAYLNTRLATQLGVRAGDTVLVRVEKPSRLPRDLGIAKIEDISFALRVTVADVLTDEQFGRFSLRASQVPPFNVFVDLAWLQQKLEFADRANILLVAGDGASPTRLVERADISLAKVWTLADAELRVRTIGAFDELTSGRVFIDPVIVDAVRGIAPDSIGVLTYFVDSLARGDHKTPYSTIAAIGQLSKQAPTDPAIRATLDLLPGDLDADEVVINQWLADDLRAGPGDEIVVDYRKMGEQLRLVEAQLKLRVRAVVPLAGAAADQDLMPEFPGISDSENCRDWEPGISVELDRIRDKDEEYWDRHRGTPKAFVGLAAGQQLWGNRYGKLTAIRGPNGMAARLIEELPAALSPRSLGLFFHDLRTPTIAAGTSATDFGGLFLGLSFFLIGAALLLTALLFVFGVEQRANEIGTLLAVGFRRSKVRRMFLLESLVLATIGSGLGAVLGMGYTRAVLFGLGTLWQDAVGATTLAFHAPIGTVILGTVISILVAVGAIALTLRKIFDQPTVELLNSRNGIPSSVPDDQAPHGKTSKILAFICPLLAVALVLAASGLGGQAAAGAFFGAGALLLIGGLAVCRRLLTYFAVAGRQDMDSIHALATRNAGRRPGRSLATIALLASGTFLVVAVQANRLEPPRDPSVRASGTGGFALFGRSTLPVSRDLASPEGRAEFGLTDDDLKDVAIVSMRVREGDDASCLNLSLAQNPRLIGVQPSEFISRGAFEFGGVWPPEGTDPPANPWQLLETDYGADVVPAIGDGASITWALHKSLGDDLEYTDEQGRSFRVRLVGAVTNSILQGNLVIAESHLRDRFPSANGYRMFLIDVPEDRVAAVEARLTSAFEDIGLELTSTSDRLADFNAVQNTYLLIFQALGGLGLLLGSIGVGVVVLRNTVERRSELALLSAVGYRARTVRKLVWSEHSLLLGMGLLSGVVAALLAVLPGSSDIALGPTVIVVAAVALSGAVWVKLASAFATRGALLSALRDD